MMREREWKRIGAIQIRGVRERWWRRKERSGPKELEKDVC